MPAASLRSSPVDPQKAQVELRRILAKAWEDSGLKLTDFAAELGVKHTTVSNIIHDRGAVSGNIASKLIAKFKADPEQVTYLLGVVKGIRFTDPAHTTPAMTRSKGPKEGHYPVIGLAQCGKWEDERDMDRAPWGEMRTTDLFSDVKTAGERSYVVVAKGPSMTGSGINDGDSLLVDPAASLENGRIALVRVDGKVTVKKWREWAGGYVLIATNPDYTPQETEIKKDEYDDRVAWAHRVVAHRAKVRHL